MSAVQNAVQIRNLFLQKEIDDVLKPLHDQKSNLSLAINALSVLSNSIQKNTLKYEKDIEQHCNKLIEEIQFKKQQLLQQLSLIETRKLAKIKTQRELLTKSRQNVVDSLTACDSVTNSGLKPYEKKERLKLLTNDALNALETPPKLNVKPNVSYTINDIDACAFMCKISDDFLSQLPIITNISCNIHSHKSATIHWNAKLHSNTFLLRLQVTDKDLHYVKLDAAENAYAYELDGLTPNQEYNINVICIETNVSTNTRVERHDFKPISLRFKTKKAPKPKLLKLFQFALNSNNSMKVSKNGLSVSGCGQLRFGEYLKAEKQQVYQVTFSTQDVDPENCAIGFATKGFINTHNNHRMLVYGNKKVLSAKEFKKGKSLSASAYFWRKGDEIVIEINMKRKEGIMHRKFKDDIGIDRWDDFYRVDLPDFVAICVRFASNCNTTQTLTVTHQKFV